MNINPADTKAPYYLGNLYYDKRQYDIAIELWNISAQKDASFPTVWRNLALATFNKLDNAKKAKEYIQRAFILDKSDARLFMEYDQLLKRLRTPHEERFRNFMEYEYLIGQRDDLVLEKITLLNQLGRYNEAKELLDSHIFHPWEGGEGKVSGQYQYSRVEMAKIALKEKRYEDALALLTECLGYPEHLGEGKLHGAQENDFYYLMGCAYDALGYKENARSSWEKAIPGPTEPAAALYYNDAKPDKIFYQGMALLRLGRGDEAKGRFYALVNYGEKHIFDEVKMDYFAVSLPDLLIWEDDLNERNIVHCKYMMSLGFEGLNNHEKALSLLDEIEKKDCNHQGIAAFRSFMDNKL